MRGKDKITAEIGNVKAAWAGLDWIAALIGLTAFIALFRVKVGIIKVIFAGAVLV